MSSLEKEITTARKAKKRSTPNPSHVLAAHAVDAMLDKKIHDVTVMDMRKVSGVADYFVIGSGTSDLQIKAAADAVRERIREHCAERPWHTEGTNSWQWVLLDYVDVVVHLFSVEKRSFYDLERLWGDAPSERVDDEGASTDVELLQTAARQGGADQRKAGGDG
ncbi:MAG: ribosome silencing factor [Rhodothermales bacterium]